MVRYFSEKITEKELAKKIMEAYKTNPEYEDYREEVLRYDGYDLQHESNLARAVEDYHTHIPYESLTPMIIKDLSKVRFDVENIEASGKNAFGTAKDNKFSLEHYVGLHTLNNGLSFLGVTAGGDWEYPIFFILYSDGSELRGYIPREGNTWNYVNKSAFGNNQIADEEGLKRRGLSSLEDLDFDFQKIEQDIYNRIIFKENAK